MLRLKIGSKRITTDPEKRTLEYEHQLPTSIEEESDLSRAKKRGPQGFLENQKEKRLKIDNSTVKLQKMDCTEKMQCLTILKTLMAHKDAWAFLEPVDPVKLRIPDYFRIISHPMDLGTIKSKLDKNRYLGTEEFAADVRLTFSNAMLYNPISNAYHQMAKNLNKIFEMRWRSSLYVKSNHESSKVEPCRQIKTGTDTRQNPGQTPPVENMRATKRSISCQQKIRPFGATNGDAGVLKTAKNCTQKSLTNSSNRGADSGSSKQRQRDESVCSSMPITTTPVKDVVSGDGITACVSNVQISPNKALRTAILTLRYADLICKSQNKNLFNHCDKSGAEKMRQEKERLEQRQLEIKARAESQIKAAEAARQMEAEIESKQQREKLREEARIAVENIKKTVEIDIDPEVRDIIDTLARLSPCTHLLNYNGWSAHEEEREEGEILYEEEREEGKILDEEEREEGEILYEEEMEEGEILYEDEREEGEIF